MHVFIAGATGAIGQPLLRALSAAGHTVTAMVRSDTDRERLRSANVHTELADAFNESAVKEALMRARPDAVIDQLTSLPAQPDKIQERLPGDVRLRIEGGGNLFRMAERCGVRRYLQQSSGFFLRAGVGLADESEPMAITASGNIATSARMYAAVEARALSATKMETVVLRYGFFYGPGTWYRRDGAAAETVRKGQFPIVGNGQGVWSFVHVEDAARATVSALEAQPGVYNIVDDDPFTLADWLPRFAQWVGGPDPAHVSEEEARRTAGEDAVYYATRLRGASNLKARRVLAFQPRPLAWIHLESTLAR
jgi:nucleoside-diphosphate-sugar epimerase